MGYSKHSLPRLGRCCVPLRGIATRRPFPRLASSGQPAPPPVCGYSRLGFAPTPTQYPQPIRTTAHGGAALCGSLCGSVRRLSGLSYLDIPRSLRGLCRGCVAAWRGWKRAKGKPPTAGRLWPYLFIFKSSARTTTGKAMIQRATSIFSPPQTNVNRFAVVVLVNLSAMAGAFFFNAVVSIRELVTVL